MRSVFALLGVFTLIVTGPGCSSEETSPSAAGTSTGGAETGGTSSSGSTVGGTSTTSADMADSSSTGSTGSVPDVPPPTGPDGVVCGEETCVPGDSCNFCNEDGSSSCVPATGGVICLDGWTLRCDGPEDCEAEQHCVFNVTQLGNMVSCADEDSFVVCDATPQIVCHDDQDCPSGCEHCVPSDDTTIDISFCRVVP